MSKIQEKHFLRAAKDGRVDEMEILLNQGVNIECNQFGRTALHEAARWGQVATVNLLLNRGAQIEATKDNGGGSSLLWAYQNGQVDSVATLLDRGANIEATDKKGLTAFHVAVDNHYQDTAALLLKRGAKIEDKTGWSALHSAAGNGMIETVILLLERGIKIETKQYGGFTALHVAACNGMEATVTFLLNRGAEIEAKNDDGSTALHEAARKGHNATVTLLLDRGAEIDAVKNRDGLTALHEAARNSHDATVTLLLDRGAKIEAKDNNGYTALHHAAHWGNLATVIPLLKWGAEIEAIENNGSTALHLAAGQGKDGTVNLLLQRRAMIQAKNFSGCTALHKAAELGCHATVTLLLDWRANLETTDENGYTALHKAARFGHHPSVRLLLDGLARIEAKDNEGSTALHLAARYGYHETVLLLLGREAKIEAKDNNGCTALHEAARNGMDETVTQLLNRGAKIEATDNVRYTALHEAASHGMHATVRLLLYQGAKIEARDDDGCTALHEAASQGHDETVAILLRRGAKIEAEDNDGWTAFNHAANRNHHGTVAILRDMGAKIDHVAKRRREPGEMGSADSFREVEQQKLKSQKFEPDKAKMEPLPPAVPAKEPIAAAPQPGGTGGIGEAGKIFFDKEFIAEQAAAFKQFEQQHRNKNRNREPAKAWKMFQLLSSGNPSALPYASLLEWTGHFVVAPAGDKPHGMIGKGAFGGVFKGLALPPEGTEATAAAVPLAVKRIDIPTLQLDGAGGGSPEAFIASFRREINVLSRFRHPNIVRLIGFSEPCPERREPPCLVYELLALGSLSSQLRDDGQAALFPWQTRLDILLQISTAINYLHCHNPGYPAYHRDIKADNIALSADYTAKLIDCGLFKYIAEDGQGMSIVSATRGRFGTPGYMCPSYNDTTTDYDAKSEVYSFGIVLLELLTGSIQGSNGRDGKRLMLHRSLQILTADNRAGSWPEECVRQLLDLARQCIANYEDRIETMMAVMQRLRQMKTSYFPESEFQQRIAALVAENEKLRMERDAAAAAAAQAIRKCLVCFDDDLIATDGFECTTNRHFVCKKNGCFAQITKDQSSSKARFATNGCKILCTFPGCGEAVPDHAVATYAGEDGFGAFLRARIAANEEKVVGDYEERLRTVRAEVEREVLAGMNRQATVLRHRKHIIDELLTIKCPNRRCQLAFVMDDDFDDCFALKCVGCGSHFCGWCLQDFGRADAHDHTNNCRTQRPRGLFPHHHNNRRFSAKQCFNQVHGPRRAAAVKTYLDDQHLQGTERETIIKAVEEQWNTVGVTLLGDFINIRDNV